MQKTFLSVAAVAVLSVVALPQEEAHAAGKKAMEKCYGVVKAGKNDCGNASGTHSCAGQSTADNDASEWVYVPKGLCNRLTKGSTEPKA